MPQLSLPLDPVVLAGMRPPPTMFGPPPGMPVPGGGPNPFGPPPGFPVPPLDGGGPKTPLLRKPGAGPTGPPPAGPTPPIGAPPGLLAGLRTPGPVDWGDPFLGNQTPGAFTTPAPFNPLLAQILLGARGVGPRAPVGGIMPRGPMGALGLTPEQERPRGRASNPYRS